jgi:vacuolar-type H+-ATPase subunit D/Vma8
MMEAGGPTAPLVNAMLEPALIPATEDLAQKIVTHLEKQHGLG